MKPPASATFPAARSAESTSAIIVIRCHSALGGDASVDAFLAGRSCPHEPVIQWAGYLADVPAEHSPVERNRALGLICADVELYDAVLAWSLFVVPRPWIGLSATTLLAEIELAHALDFASSQFAC